MKHIKFEFAEPLVAIQRVRNEVFLGDDQLLWVSSLVVRDQICYYLSREGIKASTRLRRRGSAFYPIGLMQSDLHFESSSDGEEIIVMKGQNRVWVENELGEDVTPPGDLDIDEEHEEYDEIYERMCNRLI